MQRVPLRRRRMAPLVALAIALTTTASRAWGDEAARSLTAFDVTRADYDDRQETRPSTSVLFFFAKAGADTRELWKSDGTIDGTVKVADVGPSDYSTGLDPQGVLVEGETFFFPVGVGSASRLWRSDGTAAGTVQVSDVPVGQLSVTINRHVIFTDRSGGFWLTDGTAGGTQAINPPYTGGFSIGSWQYWVTLYRGEARLSYTTGFDAPGYVLADMGRCDSVSIARIARSAFFATSCVLHGASICPTCSDVQRIGLWRTDGRVDGTVPVATRDDIVGTVVLGDRLIFETVADGLWWSDGTPGGTTVLVEGSPSGLTVAAGRAFFNVQRPEGVVLWTSDGTLAGTIPLVELGADVARDLTEVRGVVFFRTGPSAGGSLWRTDGTRAGTRSVGIALSGGSSVSSLWKVHGAILFMTDGGPSNLTHRELWALSDCDSAPECDDGDVCTTDACTDGLCFARPLQGFDALTCEVGEVVDKPLCGAVRLPPKLRGCRTALRALQRRAQKAIRPAAQNRFMTRMEVGLRCLIQLATRPKIVSRIGLLCADDIHELALDVRGLVVNASSR